jgi:hypothetical protein
VESSCERGNETSGSIRCWETTEWLHTLWPLEWCLAPWSLRSSAGLIAAFYAFIVETILTYWATFLYLFPPGTWQFSYIPRNLVCLVYLHIFAYHIVVPYIHPIYTYKVFFSRDL